MASPAVTSRVPKGQRGVRVVASSTCCPLVLVLEDLGPFSFPHLQISSPFSPDKRGWSWQAWRGSRSRETGAPMITLGLRLSFRRAPALSGSALLSAP